MDWRPTASWAALQQRARLYAHIREFFSQRGVLEVETPVLSLAGNPDPQLESLAVENYLPQKRGYLHTSPEFAMKRLLAAFRQPIFQICKVFRAEEQGRWHNSEFSMLEWYRPGWSVEELQLEIVELVDHCSKNQWSTSRKLTYFQCFQQALGVDVRDMTVAELRQLAGDLTIDFVGNDDSRQGWRDLLFVHRVEPWLKQQSGLVFVVDFPAEVAALACLHHEDPGLAQRFELFINGVEIANGYNELTDSQQLRQRWHQDNQHRETRGQVPITLDENLLRAMEDGLPSSAGVALGLDRLLMMIDDASHIEQVICFPSGSA